MNFDLSVITTNAIIIVPVVIALVQAIKLTGWIKEHYAPLLSIGMGILVSFLSGHDTANLTGLILSGAIYGLIASGLYSGVKTTMVAQARMKQQNKNKPKDRSNC